MKEPGDIMEKLAAKEHERWSDWQRYCHKCGHHNPDGSITLDAGTVARWERQINTPYEDLSEAEKESDREQVRRYWDLVVEYFSPQRTHPGPGSHIAPNSQYLDKKSNTGEVAS